GVAPGVCWLAGVADEGFAAPAGPAGVALGVCGLAGVAAAGRGAAEGDAGVAPGVWALAGVAAAGRLAPAGAAGDFAAASCLGCGFRRNSVEEPVPTSIARRFSSVTSFARTMCGVMAKTISSSIRSRLSCAKRYLRMGIRLTQG